MGVSNVAGQHAEMARLVAGFETKSDKIRALNKAGYTRSQIKDFLNIRYQHVRNVLVQDEMKSAEAPSGKAAMDRLTHGLKTKADKIRELDKAGYSRSEIARYLQIRYQQVRNVLVRSVASAKRDESHEQDTAGRYWTKIETGGRVSIPAPVLEALGLAKGDDVQIVVEDDQIRLLPRDVVIKRVQEIVARHVPEGVSLVDELIAERRSEAAREQGSG